MSPQAQDGPSSEQVAVLFEKHRTGLLTIVFTDLVDSTALMQRLGNQAGATFLKRRRQLVREVLGGFPEGEEIETAGDSFLLAFSKPSDAVRFALTLQAKSRQSAKESGIPVQERIGLHLGELVISLEETESKAKDLYGIELATCSRVMSLAEGGQILLTRGVFDSARQVLKGEDIPEIGQLHWVGHGPYLLKGVDEPVEVYEVGEEGKRTPEAPKTSDKAQRQVRPGEEQVLGWRPAVGQAVPNTQWVLEKKLGEGGFGEVWTGRHRTLKERRVFKFCFQADRARSLQREMTLFRVLKDRIGDHPGIVRLLEVNFEEPPFYVVMDHVEGQDLQTWCGQQGGADQASFSAKLEIVAQVAEALQAAHDAGIIHRDVKPGNILVGGRRSEVGDHGSGSGLQSAASSLQSPVVKLTDFGIGQVVSEEVLKGMTRAGFTQTMIADSSSSHTGSQLYMAPELLAGKPASTRSDIYSLGVVLYQLLVGDFSQPVTADWTKDVPDELLQADLKSCFAGNPQERFAGAGQLAKRLRMLPQRRTAREEQEAAMAAKTRSAYRRGVMRTASVAAVIVTAITALAFWAIGSQRKARQMAEKRRQELYVAQVRLAHQAWNDGEFARAQNLLASQRPELNQTDLRGFEWRYLWRLCRDESLLTLETFTNGSVPWTESNLTSFSADGSKLAIAEGTTVRVWDFASRRELNALDLQEERVAALAFSPTDTDLLAVGGRHKILLWDITSETPSTILAENTLAEALAFSPDGEKLALGSGWGGRVELWDVETGTREWGEKPAHFDGEKIEPALCVAFSPDGTRVASGGGDTKIKLWDARTGEQLGMPLVGHTAYVLSLDFSPDGRLLASAGIDSRVLVWDVATRRAHPELLGHKGVVKSVAFSSDGETLVSGGEDHTIRAWNVATLRQTSVLRGHTAIVHSLAFSPDGQSLVSVSDKTVKLWEAPPHRSNDVLTGHKGWLNGVVLSPDGKMLAVPDYHAQAVMLWDVRSRSRIGELPIPTGGHLGLAISPDGKLLASGGEDNTVRLWDLNQRKEIAVHKCDSGWVRGVSLSSDSRFLSATSNGGLTVWNTVSGQEIELIMGDTLSVNNAAFSPRGDLLATSYKGGKVSLWDIKDGKEAVSIPADGPGRLNFSPDGRLVAVSTRDWSISLIDVNQGKIVGRLHGQGLGGALAFSPDSKTLVSASRDGTVRLWNVATGQTALTLQHIGPATGVSFSNDGTMMATSGADATVRLWPAASLSEADGASQ